MLGEDADPLDTTSSWPLPVCPKSLTNWTRVQAARAPDEAGLQSDSVHTRMLVKNIFRFYISILQLYNNEFISARRDSGLLMNLMHECELCRAQILIQKRLLSCRLTSGALLPTATVYIVYGHYAITIACVFFVVASGKVSARLPVFIIPLQSILCTIQYHICLCGKCTCQEIDSLRHIRHQKLENHQIRTFLCPNRVLRSLDLQRHQTSVPASSASSI